MNKIEQCDYQMVHLEESVWERQRKYGLQYYLNIPNDSLLKSYRRRAGLEAPGEEMGGWYDFPQSPAGHLIGHIISGLSRFYCNSGNKDILLKINELVHEFGKTIERDGYFYNYPWNEKNDVDYYVYDKIAIGMLDAYRYAGIQEALSILSRITDWIIGHTSMDKLEFEWYTLPENLYECYDVTGDDKYKKLAEQMTYHEWYDALYQKRNVLPGKHAYSHVNALCSAAKIYMETNDDKYFQVIKYAYERIIDEQLYASGGYGPGEAFVEPESNDLSEALYRSDFFNKFNTNKHNEAPCNSYALTKLSRYLICLTGRMVYGDVMEKVVFNAFLGTLRPIGNGITHYYDTYRPGGLKTYFTEQNDQTWPCCAGTYFQMLADYPKDIYFVADHKIYVNLYISSTIKWKGDHSEVGICQISDLPEGERVKLSIETACPEKFTISLRIPQWVLHDVRIDINGKEIFIDRTQKCLEISKTWNNKDSIHILMPKQFSLEEINKGNPESCALMYGPILLVGETASNNIPYSKEEFIRSLIPLAGRKNHFSTTGLNPDIIFRPYYSIQDQNTQYTTYFRFEGTVPDPVMIDDIHPSWIYDNEWRKEYKRIFGQEFYINDFVHKTVKNGAKARIQFQGRSVKLFASCSPMCGKVKIKLDGLPEEEIDLWRKEYIRRICIWERSDLMEGDHTLVLTACLAEKKKEEKFVEIDALEILPTVICRE